MKRKFTLLLTMLLLLGTGSSWAAITKDGDGYYTISSVADWKEFCALINNGTELDAKGKLTADIIMENSGYQVQSVGNSSSNCFKGIFDGQGYSLTYNFPNITGLPCVAPFRYVNGATIKNLRTSGTLSSNQSNLGGIVSTVDGTTVIESCESSMTLISNLSSGESNSGGIVAITIASANLTVKNCIFSGSITVNKPGDSKTKRYCGIVGYLRDAATSTTHTISNCLNLGIISGEGLDGGTNSSNVIYRSAANATTYSNNYYLNVWTTNDNATAVTTAELASGEVAYNLQGSQDTQYWGQAKLNTSIAASVPELTSDEAKKVIKLTMSNGSAAEYANKNGAMPSPVDKGALSFWNGTSGDPYTSLSKDATVSRNFAKYSLTVTSAGATTLVLPVAVSTLPTGVKAYDLTYTSGDKVTATEVTSITANMPVLINAEAGTYVFESENSEEINYDTENAQQNGALYGIYTDTYKYVPANSYVLQNGADRIGFYKVTADNTIKITSFRAYLTAQTSAKALTINYVEGDETSEEGTEVDGIAQMKSESTQSNVIYDLSGRRVAKENARQGIYVVNGKKVVIK